MGKRQVKLMIKGVLCSSGALITRFNGRDPRLLRGFFPQLEADGLEFMVYPSWDGLLEDYVPAVKAISKEIGMRIPVLHADKRIGELLSMGSDADIAEAKARFLNNCRIADTLGAELMVLHLWGGPASDRDIGVNIAALGEFLETAERFGIVLTVENVVCALTSPLGHLNAIMDEYPGAAFTVDTKMAEFHLELPETIADERLWQGRVKHLHVNDYSGGYKDFTDLRVRHIGDGHVDFAPFFERVKASGYSGFATVESTSVRPDGTVDIDKLNASLAAVRKGLN